VSADDHAAAVARLHDHLAATAERPVETDASRWLGEAEAVVADLVDDDVPESVLCDRLGHVRSLLSNVEKTEDPVANREVAAAKRLTADLLATLEAE
jgi:hypothetical protein